MTHVTSSKPPRLYTGNPPTEGVHLTTFVYGDTTWHLYILQGANHQHLGKLGWKLGAAFPVPVKANYWGEWVLRSAKCTSLPDIHIMRRGRPELAAAMEAELFAQVQMCDEVGTDLRGTGKHFPHVPEVIVVTPSLPPVAGGELGVAGGNPSEGVKSPSSAATPSRPQLPPLIDRGCGAGVRLGVETTFQPSGEDNVEDLL